MGALSLINAMNMSAWTGAREAIPVDADAYAAALAEKIEQERAQSPKQ